MNVNKFKCLMLFIFLMLSACSKNLNQTLLMHAAAKGDLPTVQQLINQGENITTKDNNGRNALLYAIINDHLTVVQYLLQNGADANSTDKLGNTALIIAVTVGDAEIIKLLHAHGADINQANQQGITPLIAAAAADTNQTVPLLLLSYGANPCLKDKEHKNALQTAEQWWGKEGVQEVLNKNKTLQVLICKDQHD